MATPLRVNSLGSIMPARKVTTPTTARLVMMSCSLRVNSTSCLFLTGRIQVATNDAKKHTNMPAADTARGNMRAFQPAERMSAEVAAMTWVKELGECY